ncbi:ABC transporter permease [Sinobaca sp. H24]|uniref:ABC transporter permease n=1 Tax=Sinobaca sp. H24 TaxID=2923376 RepID=UPI00207AF77A|nr:ABC transporter permease [Sinobaca sp. H24]
MKAIFFLQWKRLRRKPYLVLTFFVLTLLFVFFLGSNNQGGQMEVNAYSGEDVQEAEAAGWIDRLNESDSFHFELVDEEQARNAVMDGSRSLALEIRENDYRMLVAVEDQNHQLVDSYANQVFREEQRLQQAEEQTGTVDLRERVQEEMDHPPLDLTITSVSGEESGFVYNASLQALFGMTLFFSMYTIMFSLSNVVDEKRQGTWDRMIVSPLRKWEVYAGQLAYCFVLGMLQIMMIFVFFEWVLGYDVNIPLGTTAVITACFTFAVVSVGMLLIGLVRTTQQLQAVIPIVVTSMAMLGGAFWPLEIVSNSFVLALSKGTPMYYGIQALHDASALGYGISGLAGHLSLLILFGVLCMGIGINLMERRI